MKQIISLGSYLLLFYCFAEGQTLTAVEKSTLLESWNKEPGFAKYDATVKQKTINKAGNAATLKPCALATRQYKILTDAYKFSENQLYRSYDLIKANFSADYTKKIFPSFNKEDFLARVKPANNNFYQSFRWTVGDNYKSLKESYQRKKISNFSKHNAYEILELEQPEQIKKMEADVKKNVPEVKPEAIRGNCINAFDYLYWEEYVVNAYRKIKDDILTLEEKDRECYKTALNLLEQENGAASWAGTWTSETSSRNLNLSGSGSSVGGSLTSKGSNWKSTTTISGCKEIEKSKILCNWKDDYDDVDKSIVASGTVEMILNEDNITFNWKQVGPNNINWKIEHKYTPSGYYDGKTSTFVLKKQSK